MTTNDNCKEIQKCLEKLLNDEDRGFVPASTLGAGIVAVLSLMSGGSLTPALLGVGGGFVTDVVGASSNGGQSFSFDSLNQANMHDIYTHVIDSQALRSQLTQDAEGNPITPIVDADTLRLILEPIKDNSQLQEQIYNNVLNLDVIDSQLLDSQIQDMTEWSPQAFGGKTYTGLDDLMTNPDVYIQQNVLDELASEYGYETKDLYQVWAS